MEDVKKEKDVGQEDIYKITCQEVRQQLENHFSELGNNKGLWFKIVTHLNRCPNCRKLFIEKEKEVKK